MFRFFAVALVVAALFGTLYFSGNALEAWESPKQEPVAVPKLPKPKAKPKRHASPATPAHPVKHISHAKPSWLVELNATCRRGKRETESIPQASTPRGVPRILKRVIRLNTRMNRETAELVSRSGNAAAAARLRDLYAQDEALLQRILTAAEHGRYERLQVLSRSLVALARAENNVFTRLGAGGCTVSPDDLQL
jgi:hypothetical protein